MENQNNPSQFPHVYFSAGELRSRPHVSGNFLLCEISEDTELYAETDFDDYADRVDATPEELTAWCKHHCDYPYFLDCYMYADMKAEILRQAAALGVDGAQLIFDPCESSKEVPDDLHDYLDDDETEQFE